jgi:hypothetical protein
VWTSAVKGKKDKVVSVHVMQAYRECRGTNPLILNLGSHFTSQKIMFAPNEQVAGWAPELVWTLWRRDMTLTLVRNPTPAHPANILITILTMQSCSKEIKPSLVHCKTFNKCKT